MTMTREQFDALIKKLENYAQREPAIYKLRLGLLAVLGYAYIFLVLAGLLAVLALLVLFAVYSRRINFYIIKFGILLVVPVLLVVRSL